MRSISKLRNCRNIPGGLRKVPKLTGTVGILEDVLEFASPMRIPDLAIVALYLILVFRAFRIAMLARSEFASLLAVGLGATLGIQACIILAGNLRGESDVCL